MAKTYKVTMFYTGRREYRIKAASEQEAVEFVSGLAERSGYETTGSYQITEERGDNA